MALGLDRIWGLGIIAVGILWMYKRKIGIGIEGRPASFYISGLAAFVIGFMVVLLGVFIMFQAR